MAYSTIPKGSLYMNTKLYTGNGGTNNITGVGFQPDWTWIKSRDVANNHRNYDAVRGATKIIYQNLTNEETTQSNGLSAFNSDGFTLGDDGNSNSNGNTFASWNWKANGAGSANTDGSINSTVSVNTTSKVSIVSYTSTGSNATIGHGLGVVPKMIIIKRRSGDTENWIVYLASLGATKAIKLNSSDEEFTSSTRFNNTEPTSSVFTVGTSGDTNGGTSPFIAYCFAEVKGFSQISKYIGNGNSDGTFVYTGFKPAFVLIKNLFVSANWNIFDNERLGYNANNYNLTSNSPNVEDAGNPIDILSNGFKFRNSDISNNSSGGTFGYMAFAENPFVATSGTTGVPVTAR